MKFGEYNDYVLGIADEEKRIFERIADVVESNKEIRVCLIVRPSVPAPPDLESPQPEEGSTQADVLKVVEKWKKALAGKPNLDTSRVLVIPAAADEGNQGSVEVWLLPPGIAVPNPYAAKQPLQ